ncbi:MAG TPA: transglutaminase-like domain-containing protein [Vicinamibacterales bacterium]|jgi:transglutaminase-like putative cysteine protease
MSNRAWSRRDFLRRAGLAAGATAFAGRAANAIGRSAATDLWRTFEITTRVEVLDHDGPTRVWLPTPLAETPYQRTLGDTYRAETGFVEMVERAGESLDMLVGDWRAGVAPVLNVTSRITTRDYTIDLKRPAVPPPADLSSFTAFLRPTRLIPTDGIVKKTADQITRGSDTDIDRARAIYEWIVENTVRDPATKGCGLGDIRFMLESGNLSGKCADLNALFVGLARAAGIPARDVYGLRIAPTRLDAKSLGLSTPVATRAQHCRAEVYLTGFGWVPVDPADVRKVALEEPPGNLPLDDPRVRAARARLFGSWEMNWMGFNYAHDVVLPGAHKGSLPFFMYPVAETGNRRVDSLDPDAFRYSITVAEIRD